MNYVHFDLEDFLEDEYFQNWVKAPTLEACSFWNHFLQHHPEKSEVVGAAKHLLLSLHTDMKNEAPSYQQMDAMWQNIQTGMAPTAHITKPLWSVLSKLMTAAAAVIIVGGWLLRPEVMRVQDKKANITYSKLITASKTELIEKTNRTHKSIQYHLPDGSKVVMEPNSSISYARDFNVKSEREVYLSGQAFFNVTRNISRPFYVYANELVTKVLGTSFTVTAFENSKQMEVAVKTGKVAVFTRSGNMEISKSSPETILTPNHRVLYSRLQESMNKYLVEAPQVLECSEITPYGADYQEIPVSVVFDNLEKSYGIDIVYDEVILKNCLLTASFSQESLYDKIELICKAVEAEFAVKNAQIIILGKGCL